MAYTFKNVKDQIAQLAQRTGDTVFEAAVPNFIDLAAMKLKKHDLHILKERTSYTILGTETEEDKLDFISYPDPSGSVTGSRFKALFDAYLFDTDGTKLHQIVQLTKDQLDRAVVSGTAREVAAEIYTPDVSIAEGDPAAVADFKGRLYFYPLFGTAAVGKTISLTYYINIDFRSLDDADTNNLITEAYDVLVFGALAHAGAYVRDEFLMREWKRNYQDALDVLLADDTAKEYSHQSGLIT